MPGMLCMAGVVCCWDEVGASWAEFCAKDGKARIIPIEKHSTIIRTC
jgi:hypothetical protein